MDSKGYYAILEVSENASYHEIKRAYRKLARKYHPDRNNSSFAEDMIKKLNASFEVLSDKDKRIEYDRTGIEPAQDGQADHDESDNWSEQIDSDSFYDFYNRNGSKDTWYAHKRIDSNYHTMRKKYNDGLNNEMDMGMKAVTSDIDIPRGRFHIIVEPSLCMAFGSCETLAPKVFVVEKNKMINPKAKIVSETGANHEAILAAAQTCPTKAIKIIDRYTGDQVFP